MARQEAYPKGRLTDASVRALPPPIRGAIVHHDDLLPGFGIRCSVGGTKSWVVTMGQDRRRFTIGRYPLIGLAEARTAAKRLLAEHTLGKHRAPRVTLSEALETYLEVKQRTNRARTMKDTRRILTKHLEHLKARNLEAVTTHTLTKITDDLARTVPSTARHVFCEARTFFRWCVKRRLIPHSPLEALDPPSPAGSRERVLSDDELRAVWTAAEQVGGHYGKIIMLLALTGQRRGEIAALRQEWCSLGGGDIVRGTPRSDTREERDRAGETKYDPPAYEPRQGVTGSLPSSSQSAPENTDCEVSERKEQSTSLDTRRPTVDAQSPLAQCTITLPATITKNSRSHTFPVGEMATSLLLDAMARSQSYLFPARAPTSSPFNGWSKAKAQLDKKVADQFADTGKLVPWTLHDLRRTYATNLQRLGIKLEVIEALLNHVSGTRAGIVGVYQRHAYETEMREAVDTYEAWFQRTILPSEEG